MAIYFEQLLEVLIQGHPKHCFVLDDEAVVKVEDGLKTARISYKIVPYGEKYKLITMEKQNA